MYLNSSFAIHVDGFLDKWTCLAQHEPSTSQQSSRTVPTPRRLNFRSSAKLSRISTPETMTRTTQSTLLRVLPLQRWVPTQMRPQPTWSRLHNPHILLLTATAMMKVSRRHHVSRLHVLSLISHFGAFFTAKRKRSTITTSQAKRSCAIIVDDVDTSDAEGDIHDKGMVFLERDV